MKIAAPPPHGTLSVVNGSADFPATLVGSTVRGRYRLDEAIHSSANATVFRATHLPSGRPVALKMLAPDSPHEARAVFDAAAATVQNLEHAHIPRTRDRGENEDGLPFVVSEFLVGTTLDKITTPLERSKAVKLMAQILEVLSYMHSRDVVHASLCPKNIFVLGEGDNKGDVRILDFSHARTGLTPRLLTVSGLETGTPGYMAPEQITGADCDYRVDLYAAGVIWYELLSGSRAWPTADADSTMEYQLAHSVRGLPNGLSVFDPFLQRLAARDPTDRYSSAASALDALEACVLGRERRLRESAVVSQRPLPRPLEAEPEPRRRRPPLGPWIAAAALLLAAVVVWVVLRSPTPDPASTEPAVATASPESDLAPEPAPTNAAAVPTSPEAGDGAADLPAVPAEPTPASAAPVQTPPAAAAELSPRSPSPRKKKRDSRRGPSKPNDAPTAEPVADTPAEPEPTPEPEPEPAAPTPSSDVPPPAAEEPPPSDSGALVSPSEQPPSGLLSPRERRKASSSALIGADG